MKNEVMPISLELLSATDYKEVFNLFNNELVLRSYPEKPISNIDETRGFIIKITTNGCWSWKILKESEPKIFLGICSLHHFDLKNKSIQIGGTLLPQFWGQDVMRQAFQILIKKATDDFGVNMVIGKTRTSNYKAIQMAKKLGFEVFTSNEEDTVLHLTNWN